MYHCETRTRVIGAVVDYKKGGFWFLFQCHECYKYFLIFHEWANPPDRRDCA